MPNCFKIMEKDSIEAVSFSDIDDKLCKLLGVEPDAKYYVESWVDTIGRMISIGKPLGSEKLRTAVKKMSGEDSNSWKILIYLEQHYHSDAWYQIK